MNRLKRHRLIVLFQALFTYALMIFVVVWAISCTSAPAPIVTQVCPSCPAETIYTRSPYTGLPMQIDKGAFDDLTDDGIITETELQKYRDAEELKEKKKGGM